MFYRNSQVISQYAVLVSAIRQSGTIARAAEGLKHELSALKECKYHVKNVDIETCGPLYTKWKSRKSLYKNAPEEGLKLNVEYADTGYSDSPIVLCLHGAPGNHGDFGLLMNHLSAKKVRVIAPNFPDYSLTEQTDYYRHTADEKCEYLKDFLSAINIKQYEFSSFLTQIDKFYPTLHLFKRLFAHSIKIDPIDMLVTHSSAVYPALNLWQDNDAPKVKSLALINPSGHRRIKAMKPKWFIDNSVRVYLNPIGRWLYRKLGNTILNAKGVPVKTNNIDNVLLSATTMYHSNVEKLEHHLNTIREQRFPTLYVFSENDRLIEAEVFYEMATMLGISKEDMNVFDKDGNLIRETIPKNNVTTMCFHTGGHYAFLKHAAIVNQWIDGILHSNYFVETKQIGDVEESKSFEEPIKKVVGAEEIRLRS